MRQIFWLVVAFPSSLVDFKGRDVIFNAVRVDQVYNTLFILTRNWGECLFQIFKALEKIFLETHDHKTVIEFIH